MYLYLEMNPYRKIKPIIKHLCNNSACFVLVSSYKNQPKGQTESEKHKRKASCGWPPVCIK